MLIGKLAICALTVGTFMAGPAMAQKAGSKKNKGHALRIEAVQPKSMRSEADRQRDPLGIIQRQGVSSLYGGMGNMGGGSGRSANTGVGLGAHGNSQGPRF